MTITTADSTVNSNTGVLKSQAKPTLATSPWAGFSNAMTFDGVTTGLDTNEYMYFDCGTRAVITANFCLEVKIKTGSTVTTNASICGRFSGNSAGGNQPLLRISSGNVIVGYVRDGGGTQRSISDPSALAINTAYDICFEWDGTTLRLYKNGAVVASTTTMTSGIEAADAVTAFCIGMNIGETIPFAGVIQEVRLSNASRYGGAYTPATAPFSVDASTVGLWHLTSTSGTGTIRGSRLHVQATQTDSPPSTVFDLDQTGIGGFNFPTCTGATGVSAPATIFQLYLNSSGTPQATSVANTSQANNKGWQIPPTTGMASASGATRYIPAATGGSGNTFEGNLRFSATGLSGNYIMTYRFYRRASGGGLTSLGTSANSVAASLTAANATLSSGTGDLGRIDFASGETLYVEAYISVPGELATAASTVPSMDSVPVYVAPSNANRIGICYAYSQSPSDIIATTEGLTRQFTGFRSTSDSVPLGTDVLSRGVTTVRALSDSVPIGTETLTRVFTGSRALADTIAFVSDVLTKSTFHVRSLSDTIGLGTESLVRLFTGSRGLSDSVPTTESLARVFTGARALTTSIPTTDALIRAFVGVRSLSDVIPTTDALVRAFVGARLLSDSIPTTDSLARLFSGNRALSDSIPRGADALVRAFVGARLLSDSVPLGVDALVRLFSGTRLLSDSVPTTESLARLFSGSRSLSDSIPRGADVLVRVFVGTRALSETLPAGADALVRAFVGARLLSDSIPTTDSLNRVVIHVRPLTDTMLLGADSLARTYLGIRTLSDTVPLGADVLARQFTGSRALTDSIPTTDALVRALIYGRFMQDGPGDYTVRFATKSVFGIVYDEDTNVVVSGATVYLHRDESFDGAHVQTTTTAADGSFSFPRDLFDPYTYFFAVMYFSGGVWKHGTSDPGIAPS